MAECCSLFADAKATYPDCSLASSPLPADENVERSSARIDKEEAAEPSSKPYTQYSWLAKRSSSCAPSSGSWRSAPSCKPRRPDRASFVKICRNCRLFSDSGWLLIATRKVVAFLMVYLS